jgi:dephospho-CoA kinase
MRGIRHIIAEADIVIENNSSLEELRTQIIKELTPLIKL